MTKKTSLFDGPMDITPQPIVEEMQKSYMEYAMSVIIARALPDVRDGLKPVHRRILYSMWKTGLRSNAKFRKSATVVGEVLGKYHPHGDVAVYDTMVRMAQDFSMRYPLVWGQGNFGSMDGDSAAAYRYTEAKLMPIADEMLLDIEKNTVNFQPNFDGVHQEPTVLPAKLPQLLLNGTMGIAVGMATNIPTHNLRELTNAIAHLVENPKADVDELMQFVPGPDFPTGGMIYNYNDIREAYATGHGKITMRAKADIVEGKSGQFSIIVTEITYLTNKATLIEKIATLVKDKKLLGIKNLRDESNKDGVRIVIDLKKEAYPQKVLNKLYSYTDLQKNFNVNMLALVDGIEPRILNLKEILEYYIAHRRDVIVRRTQFDLDRAKERAHILEGLCTALDHIDEVIDTIKKSRTKETAHENLRKRFKFSDLQATAILEMRLQTLAGLERKKLEDELKEKLRLIKQLEAILKSDKLQKQIVKDELQELADKYGDARRTKVFKSAVGEFKQEDLVPNEEAIITLTTDGYIKRMNPDVYRVQKRGGTGVIGAATKEDTSVEHMLSVMTHDFLAFFTNTGKVYQTKAYEIPESARTAKGNALVNFLQLSQEERVTAIIPFSKKDTQFHFLFMATRKGVVKKVKITDFDNVRRNGLIAIKLDKDDQLRWVKPTTGKDTVILSTVRGQAIHFREAAVRAMGRNASGVRGIRLHADDHVIGMDVMFAKQKGTALFILTANGYGKKTPMSQYKIQGRGGSGIKTAKITPKTGPIVSAYVVSTDDSSDVIITSAVGQIIRTPLKDISTLSRATQGVRIMKPRTGDTIAAATIL